MDVVSSLKFPKNHTMKKSILLLSLLICTIVQGANELQVPAFPGAEGYGAITSGGRGGKIFYVTTLEDYKPGEKPIEGSLRQAIEAQGPRIILFAVSGTISLKDYLNIENPFITIAGQTAPGDGICLKDYHISINTHDVILRYIRSRSGDLTKREQMSLKFAGANRSIVDHCSFTWAIDENMTSSSSTYNITVQWSIIAEGLSRSYHPKGTHSMGSLLNGKGGFSLHHCLYSTNNNRNPRAHAIEMDYRNNVVYNWGNTVCYTSFAPCYLNFVNNYFKPGPITSDKSKKRIFVPADDMPRIYLQGNILEGVPELTADNDKMVCTPSGKGEYANNWKELIICHKPFDTPYITTHTAKEAYELVLKDAGATLPRRDAVDTRIIENVQQNKGTLVNSPEEVGGWPELKSILAPKDFDQDGMPDEWEIQHGLNPQDPSDGNQDIDNDGYTNVEEYLNGTDPRHKDTDPRFNLPQMEQWHKDALALCQEGDKLWEKRKAGIRQQIELYKKEADKHLKVTLSDDPSDKPERIFVDLNGKTKIEMIRIPAGSFMMGSDPEEGGEEIEWPRHKVNISRDFYMSVVPISEAQYKTIMGKEVQINDETENMPIDVPWFETEDATQVLSHCTGLTFRLPTEAEWEYACRAGTTTAFNNGRNTITTEEANFNGEKATRFNPVGTYIKQTIRSRSYPPNAWGLYDMHGNGAEYCLDVAYRKYTKEEVTDPCRRYGPGERGKFVLRGGNATSKAEYIRSAYRYSYLAKTGFLFRVVLEIPQK